MVVFVVIQIMLVKFPDFNSWGVFFGCLGINVYESQIISCL